jgi:hypothetical protein
MDVRDQRGEIAPGYCDSGKPPGGRKHADYSKRAMAQDQVEVPDSSAKEVMAELQAFLKT